jgi:cytochrome c oxidase subunit 2
MRPAVWIALVAFIAFGAALFALPRMRSAPLPRVAPAAFGEKLDAFIERYGVGMEEGVAVVAPPPGSDVYVLAERYVFRPRLRLVAGGAYTLHLYAEDTLHGFNAPTLGLRFEVAPGYLLSAPVAIPDAPGEHKLICDEYCGSSHHLMTTAITVLPRP